MPVLRSLLLFVLPNSKFPRVGWRHTHTPSIIARDIPPNLSGMSSSPLGTQAVFVGPRGSVACTWVGQIFLSIFKIYTRVCQNVWVFDILRFGNRQILHAALSDWAGVCFFCTHVCQIWPSGGTDDTAGVPMRRSRFKFSTAHVQNMLRPHCASESAWARKLRSNFLQGPPERASHTVSRGSPRCRYLAFAVAGILERGHVVGIIYRLPPAADPSSIR